MRRLILLLMALLMCVGPACSEPDGDDMDRLVSNIAGWPSAAKERAIKFAMNRRAIDWLKQKDMYNKTGYVSCYRGTDNALIDVYIFKVSDVLRCLLDDSARVYLDCTKGLFETKAIEFNTTKKKYTEDNIGDTISQCFGEVDVFYDADHVDPLMVDPEAWGDDDIARAMIRSDAPMPMPGGALRGLMPVLCPLSEHPDAWGCPPRPDGTVPDPGESSSSTGGDW